MNNYKIPSDQLILAGIDAIYQAQSAAAVLIKKERETILSEVATSKVDNITRDLDKMVETGARLSLYTHFEKTIYSNSLIVWGEESIADCKQKGNEELDFRGETRTVALLDMIDGTDLVYRDLSNWCSAIVFFYPPEREILAALVGTPTGLAYCADTSEAFSMKLCRKTHFKISFRDKKTLKVPPHQPRLDQSGVCFYGQKSRNLLSLSGSRFPAALRVGGFNLDSMFTSFTEAKPPFRIYNLGGNPMMVKVADGTMQAVFELLGQKPHDVVPGAYIARMAGAVVKDLDGTDLDIEGGLMQPNIGDLRYIIASSESLYSELLGHLRPRPA
jgi:fructose-1,6-bisphosphatase/inositol monophosphatase family enzyme